MNRRQDVSGRDGVVGWASRSRWFQVGAGLGLVMVAIIGPPIILDTPRWKSDAVWNLFAVVAAFSPPASFATYFAMFTGVPGGNVARAGILLLGVMANAFLWGGTAALVRWSWWRKRWVAYIVMGVMVLWFAMVLLPEARVLVHET